MTKGKPQVKSVAGHYEIYVDGVFQESCDTNELSEVLAQYR